MGDVRDQKPDFITQTIMSAKIPGLDRMYFLGPFAKRINFAAQQTRALNLLHALRERKVLVEGDKIAVVGAGLAGLTLVTALHLLGHDVSLFEAKPLVLERQRYTRHRHLHPTINHWPFNPVLDPTTAFPFFNWHTDICIDVLSEIIVEWERLAGKELQAKRRLHLGTRVIEPRSLPGGINLVTSPPVPAPLFQHVFFATGFEEERLVSDAHPSSYWIDDDAEKLRDNGSHRFVVSGTGDGGLIDALRLCFRNISVGVLALKVATALTGPAHTEEQFKETVGGAIKVAENLYAETRNGDPDAKSMLWSRYQAAASQIPPSVLRLLEEHRVEISPATYLVGEDPSMVLRDAAPIHKLLATWCWSQGLIDYIEGIVTVEGDALTITSTNPSHIAPREQPTFLITRHGADNALRRFLSHRPPDQIGALIERQRVLADQLVDPIADFFASMQFDFPLDYTAFDPRDHQSRAETARSKMLNMVKIWPQFAYIQASIAGYTIECDDASAWYPKRLFGADVVRRSAFPDRNAIAERKVA